MQTFQSFETVSPKSKPVALTIGTFDGVHLGHQAVLRRLKEVAAENHGGCAAVTFENHPSEILRPQHAVKSLCTLPHKIRLIEQQGIDYLLLLSFSKALAHLTAEEFIGRIRPFYNFSHLILGHDATFGRDRHGDFATIKKIADGQNFTVEYLPQTKVDEVTVSSSRIRTQLEHGDFHSVNKQLGRRYSIYSRVVPGSQNGRAIGFPTANINVQGLCLPPLGVYAVNLLHEGQRYPAVANLGTGPTLKNTSKPLLEVHIFNYHNVLYDAEVEVEFFLSSSGRNRNFKMCSFCNSKSKKTSKPPKRPFQCTSTLVKRRLRNRHRCWYAALECLRAWRSYFSLWVNQWL